MKIDFHYITVFRTAFSESQHNHKSVVKRNDSGSSGTQDSL